MKIKIIADSVSDIPKEIAKNLDIEILPLSVNFGSEMYLDGIDLTTKEFFDKLKKCKKLPTTSQVNVGTLTKSFEENLKEYDRIIFISMSSKMSGTYKAANIAKNFLETDKIDIFDSKAISFGFGLVVIRAARNLRDGMKYEEIVENINYDIENLQNLFIVDTLEYLKKGGRLSTTEAFIGNVLKLKPIVTIVDGELKAIDKVRGRKKALSFIKNYLNKNNMNLNNKTVGFFHADDEKHMESFINKIEEEYDFGEILISEVGSVVGAHAGPGCIALVFIK